MKRSVAFLLLVTATHAHADRAKSDATAVACSIAATLAGAGVFALGVAGDGPDNEALMAAGAGIAVLGPTTGHWYAGEVVTPGLAVRAVGAAAGIYGFYAALDLDDERPGSTAPFYQGMAIAGGAAYLAGAIWDLATLPRAVRRANAQMSLAPLPARSGAGLAVVGTF